MKTALLCAAFHLFTLFGYCNEPFYYFIPPKKWKVVDPEKLSKSTKIAFIANSKKAFKPSLNLGIEKVSISLQDYIEAVKKQHTANRKHRWHEVGFLQTKAGTAHISQIDIKAECGDIRSMQSILIQNGYAYVITAVAMRDDFLEYHNDFIKAFESFAIYEDALHSLSSEELKIYYQKKISTLLQGFNKILASHPDSPEKAFESLSFQKNNWKDFEKSLSQTFKDQGFMWQLMASKEAKSQLVKNKN